MESRIHLGMPDYVVIAGYCVLVVWIGLWFRRRLSTVSDYFAGSHQVPWWLAGISHYMSSFSAFSFIAYTQIAYLYGFTAITLFWASVPACVGGGLLFAKRWRRARVVTPVEFLKERYSGTLQQLCAWAGIPVKLFDDALKLFATGLFLSVICGFKLSWSVVLCGALMVSYSFFGGLWALVVTDYVQFLMKSLAIVLLVPLAFRAAGGITAGLSHLPPGFLLPVNRPYGWLYAAGFACVMFVSYNASWSLAQKYYSVANEKDASKAAYLSAALNLVGAPLMLFPGMLARHFLPDLVASGHSSDAYILILVKLLPEGMIGIILAAMLSATMAAVSSDFNAIASVLTQDIYQRLIDPAAAPKRLFQLGRLFTVLLGTLTTALSLWIVYGHREALFSLMVTVFGIFLAPTLLPILAALVSKRVTTVGALTGFGLGLASGSVTLLVKLYGHTASESGGGYNFEGVALLTNVGVTLLGLVLGSALSRPGREEQTRTDEFDARMHRPVLASEVPAQTSPAMGPILAISTGAVAAFMAIAGAISRFAFGRWLDGGAALFFLVISATLFTVQRRNSIRAVMAQGAK